MIEHAGPTLTDAWYRVGPTRPRVSPHARITRQQRGTGEHTELSYIIEDPTSARFYRLSDPAYAFIGRLDGRFTADEAWHAVADLYGDTAPTQSECLRILQQLAAYGLLTGESPLSPEMVAERQHRARKNRRERRTGKWFSITIPLINPEPWLQRYEHLLRAIWSKPALIAWSLLVLFAAVLVLSDPSKLLSPLNSVLTPSNILLLAITFLFLRAIHELGHATACKAMGGRSTEIGLIMIGFVLPLPYCDASSAWRFASTRRRVLVSMAGVIAETALAAIAAIAWALTSPEDAPALRTVCFNIMLVSGVTTLVFNLNPLLRYDGYYVLSDLTGAHNLAQRSKEMWVYLIERHAYGVRAAKPPLIRNPREKRLLIGYWTVSLPYRLFVMFSIVLLIATQYLTLGLILAAVAVTVMVLWPLMKGVGYLAGSPKLLGHRSRAVGVTGGLIGAVVLALGAIPAPGWARAPATIEAGTIEALRLAEPGHVAEIHVGPGELVEAGQIIATISNPMIETEAEIARARLQRSIAEREQARGAGAPALRSLDRQVALFRAGVERAEQRVSDLRVRAGQSGRYVPPGGISSEAGRLIGRRLDRGDALGTIVDDSTMQLEATLSDRDHAWLFAGEDDLGSVRSEARLRGAAGSTVPCRVVSVAPVASRALQRAALSAAAGGGVDVDPSDPEGQRTLVPRFKIVLEPIERWPFPPKAGHRAVVRLGAEPAPLLTQWTRRVRQLIEPRLGL